MAKVIKVNEAECIGCGTCVGIADEYFELKDNVSKVIREYSEDGAEVIQDAVDNCPVKAISIVEEETAK
jgi:ferredoxin